MSTSQAEGLRGMIEFARRWLPYGGGSDEEILVTFGVPGYEFHERLARVVDSGDPTVTQALTAPEIAALRLQCRIRSQHRHNVPAWQ
ncbi:MULTISPECIES: DUF3263 domain-containing protein [Nocardiaceae]|uniref:DUF3263 domain-containing protein n=1 Tax=Rhodococcoides corynebacterioides TaxID=53972 RepID=A0ABS2KU94_9NOCA|nr:MULTISPECIES: DUF3263 domain-containing protein [Rhodococcus]MBM7415513.1 hypothetical protein [Rhodococcus corynebacterioides]MBP1117975.1 hypothetical protein [Rhodococcus sp. PvP016]